MTRFLLILSLFISLASLPQMVSASGPDDISYDKNIQLLGQQATLGHRLVRSMCFVHSNIDPARNRTMIETTRVQIASALKALKEGDSARGIAPLTSGGIRTQMDMLDRAWTDLDGKVSAFLRAELNEEDVQKLAVKATALERLLGNVSQTLELQTTMGRTAEMRARTRIIARASSQSRLLEQAGQEACFIHLAGGAEQARKEVLKLNKHVSSFDDNMFKLAFVFPAQSAEEHPDLELATFNSWQDWVQIAPLLSAVTETEDEEEMRKMLIELSLGITYLDRELEDSLSLFMAL